MRLKDFEDRFTALSPAGCYAALRLGFYAPEAELNLFPDTWIDHYTTSGFALTDPLLHWCQLNDGFARWNEIPAFADDEVGNHYKAFGFGFGCVVSIQAKGQQKKRSLGVFSRSDRDLTADEMKQLVKIMKSLHTVEGRQPTDAQLVALRLYSKGLLQKQIADELGISVGAVKARLRGGADRLDVRTHVEAAFVAARRGLI